MNRPPAELCLLVVDDSPTVRKLVELSLKKSHFTLVFAGNGSEAIALAKTRAPRLILLDVGLPDMRATEVCEALAREPATVDSPVVLMSAKEQGVRRLFQGCASVVDLIQKPFAPAELAVCLEAALVRRATMSGRWPTSELCSLIGASTRTGELLVHAPRGLVAIYWERGELVLVASFDPRDYAGGGPDDRPADHYMEVGRKLLAEVLSAGECAYTWRQLERLPDAVRDHGRRLPISPGALLLVHADATWPSDQAVLQRAAEIGAEQAAEAERLTVRQRRILSLVDGATPLAGLAARAGLETQHVRQIAHTLLLKGIIEPAERSMDANDSRCG